MASHVAYTLTVRGIVLPVTRAMLANAPESLLARLAVHMEGGGVGVKRENGHVVLDYDPVCVQYALSYLETLAMPYFPASLAPLLGQAFLFLGVDWPATGAPRALTDAIRAADLPLVRYLLESSPSLLPSPRHVREAIKLKSDLAHSYGGTNGVLILRELLHAGASPIGHMTFCACYGQASAMRVLLESGANCIESSAPQDVEDDENCDMDICSENIIPAWLLFKYESVDSFAMFHTLLHFGFDLNARFWLEGRERLLTAEFAEFTCRLTYRDDLMDLMSDSSIVSMLAIVKEKTRMNASLRGRLEALITKLAEFV